MDSLLVQEYVTIRGTQSTPVIQPRYGWLDLGDYEDVILYLDVREVTPTPSITFETAPAAIDSAFAQLVAPIALSVGVTTVSLFASRGGISPARFIRWHATGSTGTWDATFRIWAAVYGWA
jgi:hypothetical protein